MSEKNLSVYVIAAFFSIFCGVFFLLLFAMTDTHQENMLERCLSANMEYVDGNCTHSK